MSYTAMYRKFRPQNFDDVRGQEHIVTTLKNQIKANRIGHAYLFCGTRGTGKTTVAKILAKAVNCENPKDGSPCGECAVCQAIAQGRSLNVIEIDAASNNGVDNIRQIREEVEYSPTEGKYKVYIIDEVHMLSIGAFNALLKTLEEPPAYVIFILATTEANKIPITILSRCQRYDFHRISVETIAERLRELCEQEQIETEEKALTYIAKAGDGSMRDAISLLDRCVAFHLGEKLTYDGTLEVLGALDTEVFGRVLRAILARDITGLIELLDEMTVRGRELGRFVTDFIWYLRNLMLLKSSDHMEDILDLSSENLASMKEAAELISIEELMRDIRIFSELSNQIRYDSQKRIQIEIALIKLCKPQTEESSDALLARVEDLEHQVEQGIPAAPPSQNRTGTEETPTEAVQAAPILEKAVPEDIKKIVRNWRSMIQGLSFGMSTSLKNAKLSLEGENTLLILLEDDVACSWLDTDMCKKTLRELFFNETGKEVNYVIKCPQNMPESDRIYPDLEQVIHMDITVEDEE